jgi:hypothetical protein
MVVVSESEMEEEQGQSEMEGSMGTETQEMTEAPQEEAPAAPTPKAAKKGGGRRAALRLIRENVEHVSRELANFRKNYESMATRRDKQLQAIRSDIAALKSVIAKEMVKAKKSQDALASRILSKLKAPKPAKKAKAKKSKSKGKK